MRLHEIESLPTIKPLKKIKPLSPKQARIKSIQNNIDTQRQQLDAERDRQRNQVEAERQKRLFKR